MILGINNPTWLKLKSRETTSVVLDSKRDKKYNNDFLNKMTRVKPSLVMHDKNLFSPLTKADVRKDMHASFKMYINIIKNTRRTLIESLLARYSTLLYFACEMSLILSKMWTEKLHFI